MIDAVDRVLAERAALDRGFGATLAVSTFGHVAVLGMALLVAWMGARGPRIREVPGFAVALPRGGGGPSAPEPRAVPAAAPPPVTAPAAPAAKPEPPKVLKPPKEEPRKGLPALDGKKTRPAPAERTPAPAPASTARSGTSDAGIPGLDIQAPPGLGVPGGDANGDWYLAGVQRKIWMIWTRQIKSGFTQPITVSLTITETGALEDGSVRVVESGSVPVLDTAAQRAVYSAAPFTPLPRSYGTNRLTIRAVFHPGA